MMQENDYEEDDDLEENPFLGPQSIDEAILDAHRDLAEADRRVSAQFDAIMDALDALAERMGSLERELVRHRAYHFKDLGLQRLLTPQATKPTI